MPRVLIEVRREYTEAQEIELIDRVFDALRNAFELPADDSNLRLVVYPPHRFACPPEERTPSSIRTLRSTRSRAARSRQSEASTRPSWLASGPWAFRPIT